MRKTPFEVLLVVFVDAIFNFSGVLHVATGDGPVQTGFVSNGPEAL
jgi:hypothetical protein